MRTLQNIFNVIILFSCLIISFYSCHSKKTNPTYKFKGVFQIKSAFCNKVIDVSCPLEDCCNNGQKLILYKNKYADNQKWKLIPANEPETYYIISVLCNKAIEFYCLPNLHGSEEQTLHIFNFNKKDNQKWHLVPTNNNDSTYYIYSHSDKLLIDVYSPENAVSNYEQKIQLYRCKGGQNQKWILKKINI